MLQSFVGLINEMWPVAFATFIGAWIAFKLQKHHEQKKEFAAQLAAGKSAQFTIITQLNILSSVQKQYLDPRRNDPNRAIHLSPCGVYTKPSQLDLEALQFMLEGDGAQLLNELMETVYQFNALLGTLEQRNTRHEQMQRKLASGDKTALDQATVTILADMTNSIYTLVDEAVENHKEGINKLKKYLEDRFPGKKGLAVKSIY